MGNFFDIRTFALSLVFNSLIFGIALIVFAIKHQNYKGLKLISAGMFCTSIFLILLGLRGNVSQFISVIIADIFLILSYILFYEGVTKFRQTECVWGKYLHSIIIIIFLFVSYHYAYLQYNTNILTAMLSSSAGAIYLLGSYVLAFKCKKTSKKTNIFLSILFLFYSLHYFFTLSSVIGQTSYTNYLDAGLIQASLFFVGNIFTVLLSISVFWIVTNNLEKELLSQTKIDPLTSVFNRRALEDIASKELTRVIRNKQNLSFIMSDIDNFKRFNDDFGHHVGDQTLVEFADVLVKNVRTNDIVSRYGGEEFLIILPDTGLIQAIEIAEKLRARVMQHKIMIPNKEPLKITSSFGVATYNTGITKWMDLVKIADGYLYEAKEAGKNCVKATES